MLNLIRILRYAIAKKYKLVALMAFSFNKNSKSVRFSPNFKGT